MIQRIIVIGMTISEFIYQLMRQDECTSSLLTNIGPVRTKINDHHHEPSVSSNHHHFEPYSISNHCWPPLTTITHYKPHHKNHWLLITVVINHYYHEYLSYKPLSNGWIAIAPIFVTSLLLQPMIKPPWLWTVTRVTTPSTFPARNMQRAAAAWPQGRTARRCCATFAALKAGADGAGAAAARPCAGVVG